MKTFVRWAVTAGCLGGLVACALSSAPWPTAAPATPFQGTAALPPTLFQVTPELTSMPPTPVELPTAARGPVTPTPPNATEMPSPPDPARYTWRPIVTGLVRPLYLTSAHDGSGRLFIVEQIGRIRIVQNGVLRPEPFLDIQNLVNSRGDEQGLLSVAFHPRYAATGQFFVDYTDAGGAVVIARYTVSPDPNRADPASAETLLRVDHSAHANHNGGQIVFGPDEDLYIGLGDGGGQGDPAQNAQNLNSLLGKILRISVAGEAPYGIPPDNPFVNTAAARPEIWAYGLRNPWRFAFDRTTHALYIADVGQNMYEEVNVQPASGGGENYGWNFMEGLHAYRGESPAGLTPPVSEYSHAGGNCSITGGYVYRGLSLPALQGIYLFGDYCTGETWGLYPTASHWEQVPFLSTGFRLSSFGEDENGELYCVDLNGGVYQLAAVP